MKILVEHIASRSEKPIKIPSLHVCPGFLPVFPAEKQLGMRRSRPVAIKALFSVPHPQDHRDGMRSPIPSFIVISKKGGRDQYKSYRQGNIYNIPGTSMNVNMCIYTNMICYVYIYM